MSLWDTFMQWLAKGTPKPKPKHKHTKSCKKC